MAGTVRFQAALQAEHGPFQFQWASQFLLPQNNRGMAAAVHRLAQTPENVAYGELLGPSVVVLHNIGLLPLVWGVDSDGQFAPVGVLDAGEFALFHLAYPYPTLQAKALQEEGALLQPYIFSA